MNTKTLSTHPDDIHIAADLLRSGEIVAFPTETVYGLGAVVWDESAVQKIFKAKERPADNPLIVHCADLGQIHSVVREFPPLMYHVAQNFMPGALTMLFERHDNIPNIVRAGLPTVAVRIPAHPVAQALIRAVGAPLVAPSANRSGKPSPTKAEHIFDDLDGRISAVIDGGQCSIGIESTVIFMLETPYRILRPGSISKAELEAYTGQKFIEYLSNNDAEHGAMPSPGMKYRHYAPMASVRVYTTLQELHHVFHRYKEERILLLSVNTLPSEIVIPQNIMVENLTEYSLYEQLRRADDNGIWLIAVYFPPEERENNAGLWNRISKAAESI